MRELVEYAVYGSPGELPELPDLRAAAGGHLVEVSSSEVADDWGERWKQFHGPFVIDSPVPAPGRRARSACAASLGGVRSDHEASARS